MTSKDLFKRNILSTQINLGKFNFVDEEDKVSYESMREPTTLLKEGMRRAAQNRLAMASLVVLIVIILGCIFIPYLIPYDYDEIIRVNGQRDRSITNLSPFTYSDLEQEARDAGEFIFPHIMGTDELGHDYFVRVLYGTRVSLAVGTFAALVVLIIGLIYGSISGYFGGVVDLVMMRIVDIIYSLPDMLMIILLSVVLNETLSARIAGTWAAKLGTNMISIFIIFALLYWVSMARLIRGQVLQVKQNEYVLAAKASGANGGRIIRRHILPNCMSVIIIATALQIPSAIFTESYLSFVGLGVQVPMPSLGSLASAARQGLTAYPYKLLYPALMISLIVLAFNLLGDGLRDAFDPKLRK